MEPGSIQTRIVTDGDTSNTRWSSRFIVTVVTLKPQYSRGRVVPDFKISSSYFYISATIRLVRCFVHEVRVTKMVYRQPLYPVVVLVPTIGVLYPCRGSAYRSAGVNEKR